MLPGSGISYRFNPCGPSVGWSNPESHVLSFKSSDRRSVGILRIYGNTLFYLTGFGRAIGLLRNQRILITRVMQCADWLRCRAQAPPLKWEESHPTLMDGASPEESFGMSYQNRKKQILGDTITDVTSALIDSAIWPFPLISGYSTWFCCINSYELSLE